MGGVLDVATGWYRDRKAEQAAHQQFDMQQLFAQKGIQWKVEDAKAAGIHPLYALGAQTTPFQPVQYETGNMAAAVSGMGQDVTRAAKAFLGHPEREAKMFDLGVKKAELEIELLKSRIARENANPTVGLPSNSMMPLLTGQGNSFSTGGNIPGYVEEKPLQRVHSEPGAPEKEVGAIPDYGFVRTRDGYAIIPSTDVKNRIEDQIVPEAMWAFRNHIIPFFSGPRKPDPRLYQLSDEARARGFNDWEWKWYLQEFRPKYTPKQYSDDFLYSTPSR